VHFVFFLTKSSRCVLILYIYFIIQFRQHNIKVKVTATCFDLTSHLQAYLKAFWFLDTPEDDFSRNM